MENQKFNEVRGEIELQNNLETYVVNNGTLEVYESKSAAKKFYNYCFWSSEGAARGNYTNILFVLDYSNLVKDNSIIIDEISIKMNNKAENFLNINLKKSLFRKVLCSYSS